MEVPYVSGRGRAWFATFGVLAVAVTGVLLAGVELTEYYLFPTWETEENASSLAFALFMTASGFGMVVANVLAVVGVCVWLHRAARNLEPLDRFSALATPGAAVGSFFIPFLNLIKPYRVVAAIYRACAPLEGPLQGDTLGRFPGILPIWWGTWLVYSMMSNASFRLSLDGGDSLQTAMWLDVWSVPVGIVAAGCLVAIIWSIEKRQQHLHERASVAHAAESAAAAFQPPGEAAVPASTGFNPP